MPHQNQFPASLLFWTRAIWDCGGSFSLSTWLICNHLGDILQDVSVIRFSGKLNRRGKIYIELGWCHHNTISKVLEWMRRRKWAEPQPSPPSASWLWAPCDQQPCVLSSVAITTLAFMPSLLWWMVTSVLIRGSDKKNYPAQGPSDARQHQRPLGRRRENPTSVLLRNFYRKSLVVNILMSPQDWKVV